MQQSRICTLLRALSTKERTKFAELVHSPYFNKNKKVQQLWALLAPFAPLFDHPSMDRKLLFGQLFGPATYQPARINNVISDLLHLLYQFLALRQWQQFPQLRYQLLLEELLQREVHRDIERVARWYRQSLDKSQLRHHSHYLDQHFLYDKLDRYFSTKGQRTYDVNLQHKSDQLDIYYLSSKLKIACDMASRNIVTDSNYRCGLLDTLRQYYAQNRKELSSHIAIEMYYKILQMIEDYENEIHFHDLKANIHQHAHRFPLEELREIHVHALNYCIKKINSGKSEYYQEVLELYQSMLRQGVVFRNSYLPASTFKNIITTGIRLREFDWTARFIEQYKERLLPEERANALAFNLAALYFAKEDYSLALSQLHNVEFNNASYHLGAKIIQLKSYFALQETEALLALVQASLKYIRRNKSLSAYARRANANFFKAAKTLVGLQFKRLPLGKAAFDRLVKSTTPQLLALHPMANRDWLEAAVEQLEN